MDHVPAVAPPDALFTLVTDTWTAPFWDAAREERLVIARCPSCRSWRMPPTPFCPTCQHKGIDWEEVAPKGMLFSWTVVRRAPDPTYSVPWIVAVVELGQAGGVRLVSNILNTPACDLRIGMELEVIWDHRADGTTVPRFRPVP